MKRTCKQCGEEFIISNSEIAFYKQKKLSLPKRCKNCREQNKQKKSKGQYSEQTENISDDLTNVKKIQSKQDKRQQKKETVTESRETSSKQQDRVNTAAQKPGKTLKQKIAYGAAALIVLLAGGAGAVGLSGDSVKVSETGYVQEAATQTEIAYTFRSEEMLLEHYEKHGIEMGFASAEEYLTAANAVCSNPDALHKIESEDGDDVYYLEDSNEFVVVSTDGYLRTYFQPEDGLDYFNRQ